MRPFDLLRACFYLLAVVIAVESLIVAIAGTACVWLLFGDRYQIGACENVATLVRNVFADLLAAILALLLAGTTRPPGPPPSGPPAGRTGDSKKGEDLSTLPLVPPVLGLPSASRRGLSSP